MRQADDMFKAQADARVASGAMTNCSASAPWPLEARGEGADRAGIHRVRVRVSKFGRVGEH
jgi:hypothetical protein